MIGFKCEECGTKYDSIKLHDFNTEVIGMLIEEAGQETLYCFNKDLYELPLFILEYSYRYIKFRCTVCDVYMDMRTKIGRRLKEKIKKAFLNRKDIRDL
jgi:hypothetical protein